MVNLENPKKCNFKKKKKKDQISYQFPMRHNLVFVDLQTDNMVINIRVLFTKNQ